MKQIREYYQSKENRDARYKELLTQHNKANIKRSMVTNQLMHPQYIEDFVGPEKDDTGYGNSSYRTFFSKVYKVEVQCG
jgi:hypothetical protein